MYYHTLSGWPISRLTHPLNNTLHIYAKVNNNDHDKTYDNDNDDNDNDDHNNNNTNSNDNAENIIAILLEPMISTNDGNDSMLCHSGIIQCNGMH